MKPRRWIAIAAAWLLIATAQAQELRLRLMEITDVHVHLVNYDYYQDRITHEYGLAKTATLIHAARAETRNSLLFDNGDLIQGSPLGDYVARIRPLQPGQLHPAIKALNLLGVDAAVLGNHEFNYGLAFLDRAYAGARFPVLAANLRVDGPGVDPARAVRPFVPYAILERRFTDEAGQSQTLKIGVLGVLTPQIVQWDKAHLQGRVTTRDMVEEARELVPRLRAEGAQLVVVLAHTGFDRAPPPRGAENAAAQLAEVPGIDVLMLGHSHAEFPGRGYANHPKVDLERGTINGVPAVMAGRWGDHLGIVDLVLERDGAAWRVKDRRSTLRPVWDRAKRAAIVEADPQLVQAVADEHAGTLAYVRSPVAHTMAPIHSYFAQVADDPSVQVVSQAQLVYARQVLKGTPHEKLPLLSAAAPFKTGGRQGWTYYTDVPAGPVAIRNVADLYVYPNTVQLVKLGGAQVREWLEMSAQAFNRIDPSGAPEQNLVNPGFPSYNFDTIDGVTYRIDLTQPARYDRDGRLVNPGARRIVDLQFEGRTIDEAAEFVVVTNNYRASGGGNFPGLDGRTVILQAPDETREAIVRHLSNVQRLNPSADGNWSFVPVPGVKLRFVSGAGGIAHLAANPRIRLVRDNGDGSALYEVVP